MKSQAAGFTTIELLIALGLALVVVGAVLTLAASDAFPVRSEVADMHQRLRAGAGSLLRDVAAASAVLPYRAVAPPADAPGTFKIDTITALSATAAITYWLKIDDRAETYQLMSVTGSGGADVPVVDNVVSLRFEYLGESQPPTMTAALSDPTGPWTTYGPAPSEAVVPPYPSGENCVFMNDGSGTPRPRLSALAPPGVRLVPLGASDFSDGPWCPDAWSAEKWDADLLRVRVVVATLRVQAAASALRGPASALFVHGGTARISQRWAPDLEMRVRIAPRNLNHAT